jgi:predicted RNA-binding protein YlqC (UPF0109 family)
MGRARVGGLQVTDEDTAPDAEDAIDGNELADDDAFDDMAGNRIEGGTARGVLDFIARSIASEPDSVLIETQESARGPRFRIHVAPGDMGRMIGRRGRVAQAIRTMVRVAGSRDGVDTNVDFVDD